jgi:hypothetical protein
MLGGNIPVRSFLNVVCSSRCPANFVEDQCSEGGVTVTIAKDPLMHHSSSLWVKYLNIELGQSP